MSPRPHSDDDFRDGAAAEGCRHRPGGRFRRVFRARETQKNVTGETRGAGTEAGLGALALKTELRANFVPLQLSTKSRRSLIPSNFPLTLRIYAAL